MVLLLLVARLLVTASFPGSNPDIFQHSYTGDISEGAAKTL
jgi:hypothetical protein